MSKRIYKLFAVLAALLLLTSVLSVGVFAQSGTSTITAAVCHVRTITVLPCKNGKVFVLPEGTIHDGDTVTFTVIADEGYVISALYANGVDVTAKMSGSIYTVTVSGDIEISAMFAQKEHIHEWETDFTIDKEPSCTEPGEKSFHCKSCPARKDITEIPAKGHDFGEWETVETATCQKAGAEQRKCKSCGYVETGKIEPTAHEWEGDFTVDKEPTCHSDGAKSIHCKHCDATKDSTVIPRLEHEWINGTVTKEATDTEAGEITYTCARCGEKKTVIIPEYTSPQTGDNGHLTLWLATFFGSLLLIILLLPKRRKEDTEET